MADDAPSGAFAAIASLRASNRDLLARLSERDETALPSSFLAEIEAFRDQVRQAGAYLSVPEERQEAQSVLNFWLTVNYNAGRRVDSMLLDSFDQEAAQRRSEGLAPYKGLEAFQTRDRDRFFGRQRALSELLDKLGQTRLVAVTGLSGSGKSSVVRAGLIPALNEDAIPGSRAWRILDPMVPGFEPLEALNKLLTGAGLSDRPIEVPEELTAALDTAGAPVMISVDQFEELFTIARRGPERILFLDALVHAVTHGDHRHVVVITMRSEFDTFVEQHEKLAEQFNAGRVTIGALAGPDLRAAIEQPAAQLGVRFEPGLVEELLHQVLGEPAGLPLLQFTLLELWNRREGSVITDDLYRRLGGSPRAILAQRAADVFEKFPEDADRTLTRRIFARLVQIGSGLEATGRRVSRAELKEVGSRDNVNRVLQTWRKGGLLRISPPGPIQDTSQVEVTHEALIRNWDQLVKWVEIDFAKSRSRVLLMERAVAWRDNRESLLGELSLQEAETYRDIEPLEADYLKASRVAIDRAHRRVTQIRIGAMVLFSVALVLLGVSAWLTYQTTALSKEVVAEERSAAQNRALALKQMVLARQAAAAQLVAERGQMQAQAALLAMRAQTEQETARLKEIHSSTKMYQALAGSLKIDVAKREQLFVVAERKLAEANARLVAAQEQVKETQGVADKATADLSDTKSALAESLSLRPTIILRNGQLASVPEAWPSLASARSDIAVISRSVGRLSGDDQLPLGTAFIVGDEIAVALSPGGSDRGSLDPKWIDFRDTPDSNTSHRFRVQRILSVLDLPLGAMAFLELADTNAAGEKLPPPVPILVADEKALKAGDQLAIIGYPISSSSLPTEVTEQILGGRDGGKRLSPGFLLNWSKVGPNLTLQYDNTTLPGSAGSPILDLATGKVLGMHIGGQALLRSTAQTREIKAGVTLQPALWPPVVRRKMESRGR